MLCYFTNRDAQNHCLQRNYVLFLPENGCLVAPCHVKVCYKHQQVETMNCFVRTSSTNWVMKITIELRIIDKLCTCNSAASKIYIMVYLLP